jgi:hypothetical protein
MSTRKAPGPPPKKPSAQTDTEAESDAPVAVKKAAPPPPPKKPGTQTDTDVDSDAPVVKKAAPPPPPKKPGTQTDTDVDSDAPVAVKKAPPPPPKKPGTQTDTDVDSDAPVAVKKAPPPPPKKPGTQTDTDVDSDAPVVKKAAPPPPPKKTDTDVDSDAPVVAKRAPPGPPPKKTSSQTDTEVDSDAPVVKKAAPPPPPKKTDTDVDSDAPVVAKRAPPGPPPKKTSSQTDTEVDSDAPVVKKAAPPPPPKKTDTDVDSDAPVVKKTAPPPPPKPKMREDETSGNDDTSDDEKTPVILKKTAPPPPKKTDKASSDVEPAMESDEASAVRRAPPIPPVTKTDIEDDSSGDETEAERAAKKKPSVLTPIKKVGDVDSTTSSSSLDATSPVKKLPPPPHPKRSDSTVTSPVKSPEKGSDEVISTSETMKSSDSPSASTSVAIENKNEVKENDEKKNDNLHHTHVSTSVTATAASTHTVTETVSHVKNIDEKKNVQHNSEVHKDTLSIAHHHVVTPTNAATTEALKHTASISTHDIKNFHVIPPPSPPSSSSAPLHQTHASATPISPPSNVIEIPKPISISALTPSLSSHESHSLHGKHSDLPIKHSDSNINHNDVSIKYVDSHSVDSPNKHLDVPIIPLDETPARPSSDPPKHPRKDVEFSIEQLAPQSSNASSMVVALSVSPPQRANTVVSSLRDEALASFRSVTQDGAVGSSELVGSPRQGGAFRAELSPSRDASAMLLSTAGVEQRKLVIIAQQKELERQLALHQDQLHALEAERVKLAEAEVAESLRNSTSALIAHGSESSVDFLQQKSLIDTLKKQQMQIAALSDLAASAEQRAVLLDDLVRSLQTRLQESESRAASTVQALVNLVGKKELLSRLHEFKAKMNVSPEAGQALSHLSTLLSHHEHTGPSATRSFSKSSAAPHQSRERALSKGRRTVSGGVRGPYQYLPPTTSSSSSVDHRLPFSQSAIKYIPGVLASPSSSRNDLDVETDIASSQIQGRLIHTPTASSSAGGLRKENPYDWAAYTARAQVMHNLPKRLNSPPSATQRASGNSSSSGGGSSILSAALSSSGVPLVQLRSPRVGSGVSASTPSSTSTSQQPPRLSPAAMAAAQPLARLQRMAGENPDAFANALKRIAGKAEEITTAPSQVVRSQDVRSQEIRPQTSIALKEKAKVDLASLDSQLREEGFVI